MSDSALEREVIRQIPYVLPDLIPGKVAELPARVVLDPGLSYAAVGLLAVLDILPDGVDAEVAGRLLAGRGLCPEQVEQALAELAARGLVWRQA